ncbi:protein boule-like isoform X1 [Brienomyrus brachyistius]|uniref:protein boule-like isoform X1 n=1 Tax=Brienomyrus brachyistius TaxID=42636 RepID=UPI0020B1E93C|nr:protein boule-like isoform X1 [Brienomyrus brachyistius]XP_048885413.1 protein boule-like isoform X1 [Brienomyrus brachyistius]XP_048885423.1 protein boule-like isoform X1 [Brienomyrus brachyistius]XP_048885432.1 protein boule-like isoform X1 [Brienomyrus brachyistius]
MPMMENETTLSCNQTQTSPPSPGPVSPCPSAPSHHAPRYGTVIPNRIFVGGIDFKTNENDLRRFFSQHGSVKEVKIVIDRAGISKGYGFVTFETQEDAEKILHDADRLCFRDKRLNIGQAIRKQQVGVHTAASFPVPSPSPNMAFPAPGGTMYLTTSTGYPYTYHNGVAYFHSPEMSPSAHHWPPRSVSGSPVMVTHPPSAVYPPPPTFHPYQAPAQCVTGPVQWNISQCPVPSSPLLYVQPSELLYQPVELASDGGCVLPSLSLLEATTAEPYVDHMVQPAYHQVYAQSPGGVAPPVIQQETAKEQRFHSIRRGFPHSPVSLKTRHCRSPHYTHPRKEYRADITALSPQPSTEPLK